MCLRFDACFGVVHDQEDDCYAPSAAANKGVPPHHAAAATKTHHHPPPPPAAQRNGYDHGYGHHHVNGHRASHHHQPTAADGEADRKASNDARRGPAAAAATRGGHAYAARAQEKAYAHAGADDTLRHPARNNKVVDGAGGHGAHRFYEPAAEKDGATDYRHESQSSIC